jgi:DNA repair exonuclease SbcCD ATPase subunit
MCTKRAAAASEALVGRRSALEQLRSAHDQWTDYLARSEQRQALLQRQAGLEQDLAVRAFDQATLDAMAAQEVNLSQCIANYTRLLHKLSTAQAEMQRASEFLASVSQTVDEPTAEELARAKSDVERLAQAESDLSDISILLGTTEGKMQLIETELMTLRKQQETEAVDAEWAEIVQRAKQVLHVTELPAAVMSDYSHRLNARIQYYLNSWESEFSMRLDGDLAFRVRFPDKEHDAVRLSGGQKIVASTSFRFAMADLFAQQVGVLVLDEPSTALDSTKVVHLQRLLVKLKEMAGHGDRQIIIVTHEVSLMGFLEHVVEL